MMYNGGMNGPYQMQPQGMMNEYPPPNIPPGSNMPPGPVHQPMSHFIPIPGIPDNNNFHHPNMMPNQPPLNNAYPQR